MKNIAVVLLIILISNTLQAQVVKTKDGIEIGKKSDFVNACVSKATVSLINIKGVKVESKKYCECVCDNLIPTVNSWELKKVMQESTMNDFLLKDKNYNIIMECLNDNFTLSDDYKFNQSIGNRELQRQSGIKSCVNEFMKNEELKEYLDIEIAEKYCSCAIDKLFLSGYTVKDLESIQDENSPIFNEIAVPCLNEALAHNKSNSVENNYNVSDIKGANYKSIVPLIDYFNNGYKLKISIGGISKYFLFDTGASDLIIDREMERDLLINGVLKKENYLDKMEYELANNKSVIAQRVKVDNIKIGDYTVNNVVIAIIDEGSLLCGKRFLDKFKRWEIDKVNNELLLYK